MAKVTPVVASTVTRYIITLSPEEAYALHDVVRRIGGTPSNTRRGLTQQIEDALCEADVPFTPIDEPSDLTGGLTFEVR